MQVIDGIPVWGDPVDPGALAQIKRCKELSAHAAMMADHHYGYGVPIGGVMALYDAVSPSGVGYDIGCGNKAVRTDVKLPDLLRRRGLSMIMDDVVKYISFGVGRKNSEKVDHELFDLDFHPAWEIGAVRNLRDKAANQLGTVGSGNHYVDLFVDEDDYVWIGVHFGSRGFGHGIATYYLKKGGAVDRMDDPPLILNRWSELGGEYIQAMELSGMYAYAGRDWVCDRVLKILGAKSTYAVHNHHNYAWQETHRINGSDLDVWVIRKGATPAFPGQEGFIGGSMGENAYIVRGVNDSTMIGIYPSEAMFALHSAPHGAGRRMSRKRAKKEFTRESMMEWMRGIELRGADLDESPDAYKRLDEVLAHHKNTIEILHTLKPIGVAMAGKDIKDPYKD